LELLSESVSAGSFVSRDVATEYVQLLRLYRTFLEQRGWAIRARVVTNLIQDIEEGCTVQRAAA
jgi:sensor domain CHASE-containing protein